MEGESRISEEGKSGASRGQKGGGETAAVEAEKKAKDDVAVDINDDSSNSETLCRICQLSDDESSADSQLISLGCDCKGELGVSHRSCAAAWFLQKRNRICEICGKSAKNINNNEVDAAILMMEMNEMRLVIEALETSNQSNQRCKLSFCNFLLICLLLSFFLPWAFRGIDML